MIGTQEIVIIVVLLLIIAIIVFLFRGRKQHQHQQQQQQQSVVIQNESPGKKLRVCPKCGWQNETDAKFCNDCGFKFNL